MMSAMPHGVPGKRAECSAAFIENWNVIGAKVEMMICSKIIKYS
jgi:hypothetical protein